MQQIEKVLNTKGIKEKCLWKDSDGLFMLTNDDEVFIANFCPIVTEVLELEEQKVIHVSLYFVYGTECEIQIATKKLRHMDWFEICSQCVVNESSKEAQAFLKQMVRIQVAEYEGNIVKTTYYKQIGWNRDVFGNPVYVFGNCFVGGDRNAVISPSLKRFQFQYELNREDEMLGRFLNVLSGMTLEGAIIMGYFFSGLMKQLYKEAGVPVNFILYILGKQQYRKTTLAKLTNNLYCRNEDMDFCVRTVEKMTSSVAEKEISMFKDTTFILDDVSLTSDSNYRKTQENIVEKVARLIGNNARKTTSMGAEVKEYFPNANVIITGEYLPKLPESTLTRMLIVELEKPCDGRWLSVLADEPLMLSTVAYSFIVWVRNHYDEVVKSIRDNFLLYRSERANKKSYQERIQEHAFVIQHTFFVLTRFLSEKYQWKDELSNFLSCIAENIKFVLEKQVQMIRDNSLETMERDYCKVFVSLCVNGELKIAGNKKSYDDEYDDAFYGKDDCVCIKTIKLCRIMQEYYKDSTITIQAVTKQLRNNRFLVLDKSGKSSKKVNSNRYLHIKKCMINDYCNYML